MRFNSHHGLALINIRFPDLHEVFYW
ncbi:hypothetical protein D046_0310A, partial [Vibrio parahaemolyticus V-223/04]